MLWKSKRLRLKKNQEEQFKDLITHSNEDESESLRHYNYVLPLQKEDFVESLLATEELKDRQKSKKGLR